MACAVTEFEFPETNEGGVKYQNGFHWTIFQRDHWMYHGGIWLGLFFRFKCANGYQFCFPCMKISIFKLASGAWLNVDLLYPRHGTSDTIIESGICNGYWNQREKPSMYWEDLPVGNYKIEVQWGNDFQGNCDILTTTSIEFEIKATGPDETGPV
jgi:hypothetical protein